MQEQFLSHIESNDLCKPTDTLLLAVSGGVDSMVMLHLFHQSGFSVCVAHCNFQLRGEESEGDEDFVRRTCEALDVPFFIKRFQTESYASENKLSIQMAARDLRYEWFLELLNEHGFYALATAHHLNDNLETVLMNWIHGASLESLTGIPLKNNKTIRPLLFATRDQVLLYAKENNLTWREDSSNQSTDYTRNYIRKNVIPSIEHINPSFTQTFTLGQKKLSGNKYLSHLGLADWEGKFVNKANHKISISKSGFDNAEEAAPGILYAYCKSYGFNFSSCEQIIRSLKEQSGKKFLSATHQLVIDRSYLIVTELEEFLEEVIIHEQDETITLGSWRLSREFPAIFVKTLSKHEASLDFEKLSFPLTWRKWKPGDHFYPLGMDHKKKVSDFLIDTKISVSDKGLVTVLESRGEIVWLVGHRVDNRFKVDEQTQKIISFKLHPYFVE